jgi:SAM-dependent methyltransferase
LWIAKSEYFRLTPYQYAGSELQLFEQARNWKAYFRGLMQPYLRGSILEVGAGLGANTRDFANLDFDRWTCLEPDAKLLEQIHAGIAPLDRHEVILGNLDRVDRARRFDVILYIDVLEHIEDDSGELRDAASRLQPGGVLIVLAPAHSWLFTPFDRAIGHYRRYNKESLERAAPAGLRCERLVYLDCAGLLASLGNRLVLDRSMPSAAQIRIWDRLLVPCSRVLDPFLAGTLGKSILGVWRNV